MLSNYQIKIAIFYISPTGNFKKLVPNFFDKEKYVLHYESLHFYLRLVLKLKNSSCIRIQSITTVQTICRNLTQKRQKKMEAKMEKCCTN